NKLSELAPDPRQHPQKIFVRLPDLPAVTLDDTHDLVSKLDRKTDRAVHSVLCRDGRPRVVRIFDYIRHPNRSAPFPNAARQADAGRESHPARSRFELVQFDGGGMPEIRAGQFICDSIHMPDSSDFPPALLVESLEDSGRGFS